MTKVTRPPVVEPEPPPGATPIEGGPSYPNDPQIMLSISNDGGVTWSEWVPRSMGKVGEYRQRIAWWRLGSGDEVVIRFALFDAAPFTVMDLHVDLEGGRK